MTWPIATTFENASTDPEQSSSAEHGDWSLAFSHAGEWVVDARRGALLLPMRLAGYYEPAEVAAYVRDQLRWVDEPPVQELETATEAEG